MLHPPTVALRSHVRSRIAKVVLAAAVLTGASIVALAQTPPPRPPAVQPPASQPAAGQAKEVVEKHEDGSFKLKYQVDAQGRKHGPYVQYYKGGKTHMRGGYTADQKSGLWLTYAEAGQLLESASYNRLGVLEGSYAWTAPGSKAGFKATYKAGNIAGPVTVYDDKGKPTISPVYPRQLAEIKQAWATLYPAEILPPKVLEEPVAMAPYKAGKIGPESLEQALKVTKLYRYLSGVPWQHLTLDPNANVKAQHGAVILKKIGSLTHTPSKPDDMDEEFFKLAYAGCNQSNLHMGQSHIVAGLRGFMDDSDSSNIAGIGHRRWVLKPGLRKVGFGFAGGMTAMHILDGSRDVPSFNYIAFPGEGYYPIQLVEKHYAWSIHFSLSKVQVPDAGDIKVKIRLLDEQFVQSGEAKAEVVSVLREAMQGWNVVVFKPEFEKLVTGKYWVDVTGLKAPNGKPVPFGYVVDLFDVDGKLASGEALPPRRRGVPLN